MVKERKNTAGILLIGLPVLSNIVAFIIFVPMFAPGKTATSANYQQAGIFIGIALLGIEAIAVFLIAISLRQESTSLKNIINFHPSRVHSYLTKVLVALIPTLTVGWLYTLGQAQAGGTSDWGQLTKGEIVFWYFLTPFAAAFLEETIWRGYAIPRIKGGRRSLFLTSLSFAIFHGIFNPLVLLATFVQGMIWGWTFQRTNSTIPGMALHFVSRFLALVF